jgi:hypothetical protein
MKPGRKPVGSLAGRKREGRWDWPGRFRTKAVLMKKRLEPETPVAYN